MINYSYDNNTTKCSEFLELAGSSALLFLFPLLMYNPSSLKLETIPRTVKLLLKLFIPMAVSSSKIPELMFNRITNSWTCSNNSSIKDQNNSMQTDQFLTSSLNTIFKLELPPSTLRKQETAKISLKTTQKAMKLSLHLPLLSMPMEILLEYW